MGLACLESVGGSGGTLDNIGADLTLVNGPIEKDDICVTINGGIGPGGTILYQQTQSSWHPGNGWGGGTLYIWKAAQDEPNRTVSKLVTG